MTARIRVAEEQDAQAIADIYAPAVSTRATSFELTPPDATEMSRRISAVLAQYPWLVCESTDKVVGYVYATAHRERAAYREDAQRRGIARALYTALFEILALQGYRNAYAGVTLPNPASIVMHESMGFERVGVYHRVGYKMNKWHDVAWFERPLAEHVLEPSEPIAFPMLATSLEAKAALAGAEGLIKPS